MSNDHNNAGRDNAGRFQAGAPSPNPNGRPKKGTDMGAALRGALGEKVTVTENGKRTRKTKAQIAAAQLANQSASGNLRAVKMVLDEDRKAKAGAEADTANALVMTKTDHEIVAQIVVLIAEALKQGGSDGPQA